MLNNPWGNLHVVFHFNLQVWIHRPVPMLQCYFLWVIPPGWGKLCDMVSLIYHSLSLLWVHILGSFHQVWASFVTWCHCYMGRSTIHYPYYECTFLGHSTRLGQALWHGVLVTWVDLPFIILIMSAHSWVIPPGWTWDQCRWSTIHYPYY